MTRYPRLCVKTADDCNNKHLMTGPKGNSEFGFPETLNIPRGEAEGNIEGLFVERHNFIRKFPAKS